MGDGKLESTHLTPVGSLHSRRVAIDIDDFGGKPHRLPLVLVQQTRVYPGYRELDAISPTYVQDLGATCRGERMIGDG